ncbi:MAG: bifunctional DNA primase/polymerase [Sphingomonas sp.]|nr:bifunctional DNA primase/polymerase [Sphingomonas sp.]
MTPPNANATLAAEYAGNGVGIFPCRESDTLRGKAKAPYTRNGYHGASADHGQWVHWKSMHPAAIYGLPCAPNGVFALDADRHGNGDGVQSLKTIFAHFDFDWRSVPTVKTPRDGWHVLFRRPTGLGPTRATIADAIDARDNAYIIAPGTVLPDGRRYELMGGTPLQLARAIANGTLPLMPGWLIDLAVRRPIPATPMSVSVGPAGLARQIDGLIAFVKKAAIGRRNAALYWAACRAGELTGQHGIGACLIADRLIQAGVSVGLEGRDARTTVASGMRDRTTGKRDGN